LSTHPCLTPVNPSTLVIACGAIARELVELKRRNHWDHLRIQCLPAELHNTPERIPAAVATAVRVHGEGFDQVFVAYADCGTGGRLDRELELLGIERLPGAHCYEFFSGSESFGALSEAEPGTFYLTDFLTRHFRRLVVEGLGLDRHPELRDTYFGQYRRVVLLSQSPSAELTSRARACAEFLALDFIEQPTGLAPLELVLKDRVTACRS
jgi:hypothetical protein